jgi:cytochrome c oxidase subunit II
MINSEVVLQGQTIAYTSYAIVIILLMGWFGFRISREGKGNKVSHALFYSFVGFLTILGVSLHIITYNTIPWTKLDINYSELVPDKTFEISVANHEFILPMDKLVINEGDKTLFSVTSEDLTYGFGLFRADHSMLFQMQVVPGHENNIIWQFNQTGVYTIRSTEYSGPKGTHMILEDVVEVISN